MDLATILGLIIGTALVMASMFIEASAGGISMLKFWSASSMMIVLGGTVAATAERVRRVYRGTPHPTRTLRHDPERPLRAGGEGYQPSERSHRYPEHPGGRNPDPVFGPGLGGRRRSRAAGRGRRRPEPRSRPFF